MTFSLLLSPPVLALFALAPLADWFVNQQAPNCATGNGSAAAPFCEIADALAVAAAGDTVRIAPGTYTENLTVDRDVTLIGTAGQAVTIVDGGRAGSVIVVEPTVSLVVDGLTLRNGLAVNGGGVYVRGAVTLRNSTLTGNEATGNSGGGGIANDYRSGAIVLEGCRVSGNTATDSFGGDGAGISAVYGSALRLTNCTVSGNTITGFSGGYGGGIFTYKTPLFITASTISGNDSGYVGGGIMAYKSNPTEIRNSTITGNLGGGLLTYGGEPYPTRLFNVTIADNVATYSAGGFDHNLSTPAEVRNTIIAGNTGVFFGRDVTGAFQSLGHNLIGTRGIVTGFTNGVNGDLVGTNASPIAPGLAPLADNGGPTLTRALLPTSPALDAGDPVVFEPTDQRGVARVAGQTDIGSFEAGLGTSIPGCNPVSNSTGVIGRTTATGSNTVSVNAFVLSATSLPLNAFGFFLVAPASGNVGQPGGSQGVLCLGSPIGRFVGPGQIKNSGATGRIDLTVNLASFPTPTGPVAVQPGQTWYFQAWHRDILAGNATSNFTSGLAVQFN